MNLTGKTLGRYRLESLLGQGGMAAVYRAQDEKLGRTVAVKVILPAHASDKSFVERFLREAKLVAALDHPNILPIFDFGEEGGVPFLVMPYLTGGTLRDRMSAGPVPLGKAADWIRQIGDALDAAHAAGVLHRDIKPANVLVGKEDRLALADFGIAKMVESATNLTATGHVVGTPIYMAPEQAQGRPASPASDRYALAVLAYELIAGRPPFEGETALSLMHQHVTTPPPALSTKAGGLPAGLDGVFQAALAKEPASRPPTGRALADAVAAYAPSGAHTAVATTVPWHTSTTSELTAPTGLPRPFSHTPPRVDVATPAPALTSGPAPASGASSGAGRVPPAAWAILGAAVAIAGAAIVFRGGPPMERTAAVPSTAAPASSSAGTPATAVAPPPAVGAVPPVPPAPAVSVTELAPPNAAARSARDAALPKGDKGDATVFEALRRRATEAEANGNLEAARELLREAARLRPADAEIAARVGALEGRIAAEEGRRAGAVGVEVGARIREAMKDLDRSLADVRGRTAESPSDSALRAAVERLEPARNGGRRPGRADFEAVRSVAAGIAEKKPGKAEPLFAVGWADAAILYLDRHDADAIRRLLEAWRDARRGGGWEPRSIGLLLRQPEGGVFAPNGWEVALAFLDARSEAEGLLAADLAKRPDDAKALLGRALLRRLEGRSPEAVADAAKAWDANRNPLLNGGIAELAGDESARLGRWEDALGWYRKAAGAVGLSAAPSAFKGARIARDHLSREADAAELFRVACSLGNLEACREGGLGDESRGRPPRLPNRGRNRPGG